MASARYRRIRRQARKARKLAEKAQQKEQMKLASAERGSRVVRNYLETSGRTLPVSPRGVRGVRYQ